jgi:hypothetical protein
MSKPKLYVSGAISGMPDLNRTKFHLVTKQLRDLGHDVVNPHEICLGIPAEEWAKCMRICIVALCFCEKMIMLDDWQNSRGATLEYAIATALGIKTYTVQDFINNNPS